MNISYCRTSVHRKNKISLGTQQRKVLEMTNRLEEPVPLFYLDQAFSGANVCRPAFQSLQEAIKTSTEPRKLYVYRYDRLFRDVRLAIEFLSLCHSHGVQIVSIMEPLPESVRGSPHLESLFVTILFSMAEFSRSALIENQRIALNRKVAQKEYLSARVPYGYRWETNQPIIVEDEAKIIKKLFQWYTSGEYGFGRLTSKLTDMGIVKRDKPFSVNSVRGILTNPFYTGMIKGGLQGSYHGKHVPLVTAAQFVHAQAIRKSRHITKGKEHPFPLRRKIRCPSCQHTLTCGTRNEHNRYYYCPICKRFNLSATKLEQEVLALVTAYLMKEDVFAILVNEMIAQVADLNDNKLAELQRIVADKTRLMDRFERGELALEAFTAQLKALTAKEQGIQRLSWSNEKELQLGKLLELRDLKVTSLIFDKINQIDLTNNKKLKGVKIDGLPTSIKPDTNSGD
ncbi:recombinase family protein [uncultured Vagococcus sp.]|uniref:recombinase family protein n=1 Tax=uncultured Vagococcus sp. TaxID=189676 RepID=UPI0028D5151C|nr:recombinase family protein [uncultured Vagococcus sp.]